MFERFENQKTQGYKNRNKWNIRKLRLYQQQNIENLFKNEFKTTWTGLPTVKQVHALFFSVLTEVPEKKYISYLAKNHGSTGPCRVGPYKEISLIQIFKEIF